MIRILLYLAILAVVSTAAVWIADHPGTVQLRWQGYLIELSAALGLVAVLVLAAVIAAAYALYRALVTTPRRVRELAGARRREKGYRALTAGLTAAAAGDGAAAKRAAKTADGLLGEPPLTLLLTAQAAQLDGDIESAKAAFRQMLEDPRTEFLGLRGLVVQAMRAGDTDTALTLVRRAHEINPKAGWVVDNLVKLETSAGHWTEAGAAIEAAVKLGRVDRAEGRHRRAALIHQRALDAAAAEDSGAALQFARQALEIDPGFAPAAMLAARTLIANGQPKPARKLIQRAWVTGPHPDLARLYVQTGGDAAPLDRVKALQTLAQSTPGDAEARLALADAALDAELWGQAREQLKPLVANGGPARAFRLMARLEEGENGDLEKSRTWLMRAAEAGPDAAWRCGACGTASADWTLACETCGAIDSLRWRRPTAPADPDTKALPAG